MRIIDDVHLTLEVYLGIPDGDDVANGVVLDWAVFLRPMGMYVELCGEGDWPPCPLSGMVET